MLGYACVCDVVGGARDQMVGVRCKITVLIGNKVGLGFFFSWAAQPK